MLILAKKTQTVLNGLTLAIMGLLVGSVLAGGSDLSAKNANTSPQAESLNTHSMPDDSQQSPKKERSIWVSVANTMANMRCH